MRVFIFLILGLLAISGCSKNKLNIGPEGPLNTNMNDVREIDAEGLVRMAETLDRSGDFKTSGQLYLKALARDPNYLEAHLGLAKLLENNGNYNEAATYYQNVLVLDPNNLAGVIGAAGSLISQERAIDARQVIERYLTVNPPTATLMNYLGVAKDLGADQPGAQTAYRQGLALVNPGNDLHVLLLNNLALSLSLGGSYSEAIMLLNPHLGDMRLGAEGISSAQSSFRQNLALVYALSGNLESAVDVATSALGRELGNYNRGFYQAIPNLNDYEQARAVFLGVLPDGTC